MELDRVSRAAQKHTNVQKMRNLYTYSLRKNRFDYMDRPKINISIDRYQISKNESRIRVQGPKLIKNNMQHDYIREFVKNLYIDRTKIDIFRKNNARFVFRALN